MRIESKKTSYTCCVDVCVYVRIVEVEEYLDAKSDDTLDVCRDGKKILSLFPLGTQKATMAKKKKNGRSKIAQKIVFSPVLEKEDFVSCDTLFGLC